MVQNIKLFENGSTWLKADFHLHTIKDPLGIKYNGNPNEFFKSFLDKLEEQKIKVGVITNHNNFYLDEFKELRKKALKQEIFLLPGMELNVGDGSNGIHILIVFDYETWVDPRHNNKINKFIGQTFGAKQNKPPEMTKDNLIGVIERLNKFKAGYFIILAHVNREKGFFKAIDRGRRERDFYGSELFRKSVLGFQKVETRESEDEMKKFYDEYRSPAFVDGSDPKKIEEIGQNGKDTYIKIGDFNFDAVKYALLENRGRVKNTLPKIKNAYIKNISFVGGLLDSRVLHLNSNMNNFIGIRGSGKSTLLEAMRCALDISFSKESKDQEYKEKLVDNLLGSGGKIIVNIVSKDGLNYRIEKIYNKKAELFRGDTRLVDLKVSGIIDALYYGQKDLTEIGSSGFAGDLVEKFCGDKTEVKEVRESIFEKEQEIISTINEKRELEKSLKKRNDFLEEKAKIKEKLENFNKFKVVEKLEKQANFEKDRAKLGEIIEFLEKTAQNLFTMLDENSGNFDYYLEYKSAGNEKLFAQVTENLLAFRQKFDQVEVLLNKGKDDIAKLKEIEKRFREMEVSLQEEFAKIRREIDLPELKPDDYLTSTNRLNIVDAALSQLEKKSAKQEELNHRLETLLDELQELRSKEFESLKRETDRLNDKKLSLRIEMGFKKDKKSFEEFLGDHFKGTWLSVRHREKICAKYRDPVDIYRDLFKQGSDIETILTGGAGDIESGNLLLRFKERTADILETFLTFRVPPKVTLYYNDKELGNHSLGQRASAFILFILTKRDHDLVIIDQPEDDLDNQSIYKDVIKGLTDLKQHTQFIFATHNPNIPVLGGCEQVIRCSYPDKKIEMKTGSIDCKEIQKEIIRVMEGGKEAFEKRKEIYELWKH